MIVKVKSGSENAGRWLGWESEIVVLSIRGDSIHNLKYLVWSAKNEAAVLFPASDFEITDGRAASVWCVDLDARGFLDISPREWQAEDFWDRYHDDDVEAVRIFEEVSEVIGSEARGHLVD